MTTIKTPSENIIKSLKNKRMLFLENGNCLENGVEEFERILKGAKIEYTILFNLNKVQLDEIVKAINEHDGIVFMTQWVYEISHKLRDYMFALKEKTCG